MLPEVFPDHHHGVDLFLNRGLVGGVLALMEKPIASRCVKPNVRATISRGNSFSDLKKVRVIVDAEAATDAVEALIRNSWTHSDVFVIEEAHEDLGDLKGFRSSVGSARDFRNPKI